MHNKKAQNSGKVSSQPNALSFERKKNFQKFISSKISIEHLSSFEIHWHRTDKDFCRNLILQVLNTGETIDLGFSRSIFLPPSLPPIFFYEIRLSKTEEEKPKSKGVRSSQSPASFNPLVR